MKKFLLATAAVLASTSAYAADYAVVHPFYTPAQGKFVSTTGFAYKHMSTHVKDADVKARGSIKTVSEEVKYGVTNDIQAGLKIGREWLKDAEKGNDVATPGTGRNYTNSWGVNVVYNVINDDKAFLNVGLQYLQQVVVDGAADEDDDEHSKEVDLKIFGGYNFDAVTVFGSIGYDHQVDGEKENMTPGNVIRNEKKKLYTLEAGAYKAFNDHFSARTSLSAEIDETKDDKRRTYWWNIGADYAISKKMAVGLDAGYMLDNDNDDFTVPDTHRGYKLGVDFTVEF